MAPFTQPDYYANLGLESNCTQTQIRQAYTSLSRANKSGKRPDEFEAAQKLLDEAYYILGYEVSRKNYDQVNKLFQSHLPEVEDTSQQYWSPGLLFTQSHCPENDAFRGNGSRDSNPVLNGLEDFDIEPIEWAIEVRSNAETRDLWKPTKRHHDHIIIPLRKLTCQTLQHLINHLMSLRHLDEEAISQASSIFRSHSNFNQKDAEFTARATERREHLDDSLGWIDRLLEHEREKLQAWEAIFSPETLGKNPKTKEYYDRAADQRELEAKRTILILEARKEELAATKNLQRFRDALQAGRNSRTIGGC